MRPDGVGIADHDVGFLRDPKVMRLAKAGAPWAIVAYLAVRDASWDRGERVAVREALDALPRAYQLDEEAVVAALLEVGLLDAEGLIPLETWTSWFGPVEVRKAERRESGRKGGLVAAERRRQLERSSPTAPLQQSSSSAVPVTSRPVPSGTRDVPLAPAPAPAGGREEGPPRPRGPRLDGDGRPMVDDGDRRSFRERVAAHGGPVP